MLYKQNLIIDDSQLASNIYQITGK